METAPAAGASTTTANGKRPLRSRVRREPLLHFLLLGLALLAAERWVGSTAGPREIVVSEDLRNGLRADHLRRTGQWPTLEEEEALIARHVDDEVLYREALALGLDRGDVIVRRRLVQKMEFLVEEEEALAEPADRDLESFLTARSESYREPERVSLRHVFVASDRHGDEAARLAGEIRDSLIAGGDPNGLGDPFLRGREFTLRSRAELAAVFGPAFAAEAMRLPAGSWSAPIRSSYGLHLVRLTDRRPARLPGLDEIREAVRRDWLEQQRAEANRRSLARLRERYDVRIEGGGHAVEMSSSR
jgi:hypothetical protein